jgi:hypothetical protein
VTESEEDRHLAVERDAAQAMLMMSKHQVDAKSAQPLRGIPLEIGDNIGPGVIAPMHADDYEFRALACCLNCDFEPPPVVLACDRDDLRRHARDVGGWKARSIMVDSG